MVTRVHKAVESSQRSLQQPCYMASGMLAHIFLPVPFYARHTKRGVVEQMYSIVMIFCVCYVRLEKGCVKVNGSSCSFLLVCETKL